MSRRLTDAQFDELLRAIPYPYEAGDYPEDLSEWAREWIGPDGGTLSLLNELAAERSRRKDAVAAMDVFYQKVLTARRLHFQYRAAAENRFDCCGECSRVSSKPVPWPCATYKAVTGDES